MKLGITEKLEIDQGSDEWLNIRKGSITSTDIAKAVPKAGDKKSMIEKFISLKNAAQTDLSDSLPVQMGKEKESEILKNFVNRVYTSDIPEFDESSFVQGEVLSRTLEFKTESGEYSNRLLSSHDGSVYDMDGNLYSLEAKYSTAEYNFAKDDYILPSYLKQVAHHLLVNKDSVGCYLIISNCQEGEFLLTNIHYIPRNDERVTGIATAIMDLASAVHVIKEIELDRELLFWQLAKSPAEIKQKFDSVAKELAKLSSEFRTTKNKITALELQLKSLPFAADYTLFFPEYDTQISLEMKKTKKFNSEKYENDLCRILNDHDIDTPNKRQYSMTISYQALSVKKI